MTKAQIHSYHYSDLLTILYNKFTAPNWCTKVHSSRHLAIMYIMDIHCEHSELVFKAKYWQFVKYEAIGLKFNHILVHSSYLSTVSSHSEQYKHCMLYIIYTFMSHLCAKQTSYSISVCMNVCVTDDYTTRNRIH